MGNKKFCILLIYNNQNRNSHKKCLLFKLSEIWYNFDESTINKSINKCGITSSSDLHDELHKIVNDDMIIDEILIDAHQNEDINAFNVH